MNRTCCFSEVGRKVWSSSLQVWPSRGRAFASLIRASFKCLEESGASLWCIWITWGNRWLLNSVSTAQAVPVSSQSDWYPLCCESAVTGRAVSEGLPALRDAAHLKTHHTTRKGSQEWESSQRPALIVGSGEHSAPVLCHAWLLTRLQDTDLGQSSPDGTALIGVKWVAFVWCCFHHICAWIDHRVWSLKWNFVLFFILSFYPRVVAHLTDEFPELSEQLS